MIFSRSCVFFISVHSDVTGTRDTFQGLQKYITLKLNISIQNVERSRMYPLYSAHVTSCHCFMFTEHYHRNIFGIEWDRNIIIKVISDHLSHAQGRWLVYFSFTKLERRPNGHVAAATAHYHVSRPVALVLEIYLSYYHLLTQAIMPILNWLDELLICLNHSTQRDHPKYYTSNWSLTAWRIFSSFHASIYPSQTRTRLSL